MTDTETTEQVVKEAAKTTTNQLQTKIKELELELSIIKNEKFTSDSSAFKGLNSHAVR